MNIFRCMLVIATALLISCYVLFFIYANGFRKSFGASENHPLLVILPVSVGGILLAGLLGPTIKPLLHAAAVAAAGSIGFCIWMLIRESSAVFWFGIFYLCAWMLYYGFAVWSGPVVHGQTPQSPTRTFEPPPARR